MTQYLGNDAANTWTGSAGDDVIFGQGGQDELFAGDGSDMVLGGQDDDILAGDAGSDVIYGAAGNDLIYTDDSSGTLASTSLREYVDAGSGNDTVLVNGAAQHSILTGVGDDEIRLTGNSAISIDDVFDGGDGLDILNMAAITDGIDVLLGDYGIFGIGASQRIGMLNGFETLISGSGNDSFFISAYYTSEGVVPPLRIESGAGDDTISTFTGNNTLYGGSGDDFISTHGTDDLVFGDAGDDYISIQLGIREGRMDVDGGAGNDTVFVNEVDITLLTSPDNIVRGGDQVGSTDSLWVVAKLGMTAQVDLAAGTIDMSDGALASHLAFTGFEDFWLGAEDDNVFGNDGQVTVTGDAGNDTLANTGDQSTFYGGAGDDLLYGGANVHSLLYGDDGNDTLYSGLKRADTLNGGAGDDKIFVIMSDAFNTADDLRGGAGVDTVSWSGSTRANMVLDLGLGTATDGIVTLSMTGFEHATGSDMNDTIAGSGVGNILRGGGGADDLDGNNGADKLYAGNGTGIGHDDLNGGKGDDSLYGDASELATWFFGVDGNDFISVGTEIHALDLYNGGAGIDKISFADTGVAVDAVLGATGTVEVGVTSITMAGFENFVGGTLNDTVTGDATANQIYGGGGNDVMLAGGAADLVYGNDGDDYLGGGDLADTLQGGDGADTLTGGNGADSLTGGTGADHFLFESFNAAGSTVTTRDKIADFEAGVDDLDVSGIAGLTWINTAAFAGVAMQMRQVISGGHTFVYLDTDGDKVSDFQIMLVGLTPGLSAGDLIL